MSERDALELQKLRAEVGAFRRPTRWEVIKTVITVVGIGGPLSLSAWGFWHGLEDRRHARLSEAIERFHGDLPHVGASQLAAHGIEGTRVLVTGIAHDEDSSRPRTFAALAVLATLPTAGRGVDGSGEEGSQTTVVAALERCLADEIVLARDLTTDYEAKGCHNSPGTAECMDLANRAKVKRDVIERLLRLPLLVARPGTLASARAWRDLRTRHSDLYEPPGRG